MGALTTGEAIIKLRLDVKDAEAEYRRWLATMKGGAVAVPGIGPGGGGGTVPGGGGTFSPGGGGAGGSFLGGALGGLLGASGIIQQLARATPFSAALMEAGEGTLNYAKRFSQDVLMQTPLGGYVRQSEVAGSASDRTRDMLKFAAGGMSDAQINAIQGMNLQMAQLEADNATRVDQVVGKERLENMADKITNAIFSVKDAITQQGQGGAPSMGGR